jgi:hypothetical protein
MRRPPESRRRMLEFGRRPRLYRRPPEIETARSLLGAAVRLFGRRIGHAEAIARIEVELEQLREGAR